MFNNIGNKIKIFSQILTWVGMILSIIVGFSMMSTGSMDSEVSFEMQLLMSGFFESLRTIGFFVMVIGSLLSWIGGFLLYGFGELIERTQEIARNTRNMASGTSKTMQNNTSGVAQPKVHQWRCSQCGNMTSKSPCEHCGQGPVYDD